MPITGESVLADRLEDRDCGAGGRLGSMGLRTGGKRPWIPLRDARCKGAKEAGEKGERQKEHSRKRGARQIGERRAREHKTAQDRDQKVKVKTVQPQVQGGDRETVTRRANLSKVGKKGKRMKSCKRQKTTKSAGGNKKKKTAGKIK